MTDESHAQPVQPATASGMSATTLGPAPSEPREPAVHPPLETLLELQDLDTVLSQLQHRKATLPERQELARLTSALSELGRRAAEIQGSRRELVERQEALEADIATTTARRESLEQRMYAARGTPARDLQAMDEEVRHLRERRGHMEDAELEVMVALEPLDAELATLEAQGAQLRAQADQVRATLGEMESGIEEELTVHLGARDVVAAALPEDLRGRYESLRARLGGTGAARLVGTRCSGCHLELPSMEVERIRHLPQGTVVTCEQCGRILVLAAPSPAG
ncbi:MAG TPA: C4-type zinc ribbon domain-containing protein [Acidimicrobiales bacterium]|nr:C4-type zinc ribbon domain-containing protein [Acidimicrobiales bacterium]